MNLNDLAAQLWPFLARLFLELGAYTPTYQGGTTGGTTTYLIQEAEYIRIGNVYIVNGRLNWSAATGTGNARISLPTAIASAYRSTGSVFVDGVTFANGAPQPLLIPGNSYFELYSPLTNTAPTAIAVETAGLIIWSIVYIG